MDCFLSCFGIKYFIRRKSHMYSDSFSWKIWELVVPRNHYTPLESSKEKGSSYGKAEWDINDVDDSIHQELRQEAKIRKTRGIILSTHHLENCKAADQHYPVSSDACHKKANYEEQLDKSSRHPYNSPETSTFSQENSKSCQFEKFEEAKHPVDEKQLEAATLDISPRTENQMGSCESPYPTPLNLAAGMQTPGTVYPPKPQNFRMGTIRSQLVYAVPGLSQSTKYKEDQKVSFETRLEKVLSDERGYYPPRFAAISATP